MRTLLAGLALLLAIGCRAPGVLEVPKGQLQVLPAALDFGDVFAGARAHAGLKVTNGGSRSVTLTLGLTPPFEGPASLEVPGGASVPLELGFSPIAEGRYEATLDLGGLTVGLSGAGLAPLQCEAPNACTTSSFDPFQGQCRAANQPDGLSCGTRCVISGSCASGQCLGSFVSCDDHNACTDDGCIESTGCMHAPHQCPGTEANPCRVAACDPAVGCLLTDAVDGTSCGLRNCHTNTTRVCILGQCVSRPLASKECLDLSGYLKASNSAGALAFGGRVAVSADGNTLAVASVVEPSGATGVDGDQTNLSAPHAGAVYVFHRVNGQWTQEAYLKASNAAAFDSFGSSLALSADGSTLAVGAHLEDSAAIAVGGDEADDSALDSGAVYIFRRLAGAWSQEAYLKATNTQTGDDFGAAVALSGDGATLAVGAPGEDSKDSGLNGNQLDNTAEDSGAVYLYRRAGGWVFDAYVKASNTGSGDLFGYSVGLSSDGRTLAVAALGEDSKATGSNGNQADNSAPQSGAVYVFRRAWVAWAQDAYLKASNTQAADVFGISLALSGDGTTLAVGAYGEDSGATGINGNGADGSASQSGAAYVYERGAAGWAAPTYFKASNTHGGDDFGFCVALADDGKTLAVGAWAENSKSNGVDGAQFDLNAPQAGAVYLFRRVAGPWKQLAYVKASNTDPDDAFGGAVALSGDGTTLICAAVGEDSSARGVGGAQGDNAATESGAVYVFSAP